MVSLVLTTSLSLLTSGSWLSHRAVCNHHETCHAPCTLCESPCPADCLHRNLAQMHAETAEVGLQRLARMQLRMYRRSSKPFERRLLPFSYYRYAGAGCRPCLETFDDTTMQLVRKANQRGEISDQPAVLFPLPDVVSLDALQVPHDAEALHAHSQMSA